MSVAPSLLTHSLERDDPANVLTRMTRQTCTSCGASVLTRPDGTQYGSATVSTCETVQAMWASAREPGLIS